MAAGSDVSTCSKITCLLLVVVQTTLRANHFTSSFVRYAFHFQALYIYIKNSLLPKIIINKIIVA